MSDVFERLSAADPFAEHAYELHDSAAFMTRVTKAPAGPPLWRRFQLGVSGALAATTLVMVGAIAALQGAAPSLPLLNFALASTTHAYTYAPSSTKSASTSFTVSGEAASMSPRAPYRFAPSRQLSNAASVASAYQLRTPGDLKSETLRVSSIFGVVGVARSLAPTAWQVSTARATMTFALHGLWTWRYVTSSTPAANSVVETVPVAVLTQRAARLIGDLGYDYRAGQPVITTGASNAQQAFTTVNLRFSLFVDGTASGLSADFTFSNDGLLLRAEGPAFYVASSYLYPLLSPVAGVAALNAHETSLSPGPPSNVSMTDVHAPRATEVRLRTSSLALRAYRLSDDTFWLVPTYTYRAQIKGRASTWSLLALDPRFTKNAATASPISP